MIISVLNKVDIFVIKVKIGRVIISVRICGRISILVILRLMMCSVFIFFCMCMVLSLVVNVELD